MAMGSEGGILGDAQDGVSCSQFSTSGQKVGTLRQVLPRGSWLLPGLASLCQGLGLVSESWLGSRLGPRQTLSRLRLTPSPLTP